jgi:hypothetical protein
LYKFAALNEFSLLYLLSLGKRSSLLFFGKLLLKYFPALNLPPASGEYAKSPQFSFIDTSE